MKGKKLSVDESIRVEAYLLSEKAGHPPGLEHYFWKEAEAIVHARTKAVDTAVKKSAAKGKGKTAAQAKTPTKPKAAPAKAKAAAKPKAAAGQPVSNGANGKAHQLSLDGGVAIPTRRRTLKK